MLSSSLDSVFKSKGWKSKGSAEVTLSHTLLRLWSSNGDPLDPEELYADGLVLQRQFSACTVMGKLVKESMEGCWSVRIGGGNIRGVEVGEAAMERRGCLLKKSRVM